MAAPPTEACPACAGLRARRAGGSSARRGPGPARGHPDATRLPRAPQAPRLAEPRLAAVEEVRSLLALSVGKLATRLGLNYSTVLDKAQEKPLSPGLRDKLLALKREHLAAKP